MIKSRSIYLAAVVTLAILLCPISSQAQGQDKGNGGDFVRATFLNEGAEILREIRNNPKLRNQAQVLGVNLNRLSNTLHTTGIKVVDEPLYDSRGSRVDAVGGPGHIKLDRGFWKTMILQKRDVRLLVLHEMIRAANYNDDDYRLSKQLILAQSSPKNKTKPASVLCQNMNRTLMVGPKGNFALLQKVELLENGTTTLYHSSNNEAQYSFNPNTGDLWIGPNGADMLDTFLSSVEHFVKHCTDAGKYSSLGENDNLDLVFGKIERRFEMFFDDARRGKGFSTAHEQIISCAKQRFSEFRMRCDLSSLRNWN